VVAQQSPQIPQTVLLAQSPGQQGAQTKTIIILQQPQGQSGQQQKIIMTPSGQQVIYSSPVQRQTIGQQVIQTVSQPVISSASIIQSTTSTQAGGRKIVITNAPVDGSSGGQAKIIHNMQQQMPTKIVQHASSQQTLQAIAQGQNIIVQKGQKFQIGSTQISQVISPAPQQHQQQTQLIQQTVMQQVQQQQMTKIIQRSDTSPVVSAPPTPTLPKENPIVEQKKVESLVADNSPIIPTTVNQEPTKMETNDNSNESTQQLVVKSEENDATKDKTPTSSGSSSPAPNGQNKQTISIQIPVPQSQLAGANAQQYTIKIIPSMDPSVKVKDEDVDVNWLYICEWRGCPKKKFSSANEVYLHACAIHCPSLEGNPDL
jgi:AT-rich interactive domain-containing protein 2